MIRIADPGPQTTVQDLGRWGFQSSGVSVAGPMDPYSHRLANALVGNAGEEATLEVTLTGPELECDDERVIAMAGAEFELTIDETLGKLGHVHIYANGGWQPNYQQNKPDDLVKPFYGAGYGARVEIGPVHLAGGGHWGR